MPLDEFGREIPGMTSSSFASSSSAGAGAARYGDDDDDDDDHLLLLHDHNKNDGTGTGTSWMEDTDMNDRERDRILQRQRHEQLLLKQQQQQQRDAVNDHSNHNDHDNYYYSPPSLSSPAADNNFPLSRRRRSRSRSRSRSYDGGKSLHPPRYSYSRSRSSYNDRRGGRYRHDSYGAEKRQRYDPHDSRYSNNHNMANRHRGDSRSLSRTPSRSRSPSPFGSRKSYEEERAADGRRMSRSSGGRRRRRDGSPRLKDSKGNSTAAAAAAAAAIGSIRKEHHHPCLRYADEPLLCQRLFRNHEELKEFEMGGGNKEQVQSQPQSQSQPQLQLQLQPCKVPQEQDDGKEGDKTVGLQGTEMQHVDRTQDGSDANGLVLLDDDDDAIQSNVKQRQLEQYMSYNKARCLKYVRSFFNHHLDDEWFRQRYSPLEYKRKVQSHRERAALEAYAILEEVEASIGEFDSQGPDKGANHNGTVSEEQQQQQPQQQQSLKNSHEDEPRVPSFVLHARLGGGVKPLAGRDPRDSAANRKRKYSSTLDAPHYDRLASSGIPKSHLFSFLQQDTALYIMDVPSNVTDNHILMSLRDHADGDMELFPVRIMSGDVVEGPCEAIQKTMVVTDDDDDNADDNDNDDDALEVSKNGTDKASLYQESGRHNNGSDGSFSQNNKETIIVPKVSKSYMRNTWVLFQSAVAKQKVLKNIIGAHMENVERRHKDDHHSIPREVELFVDCSDPFGRYEIDADGKGNAPVLTMQNLSVDNHHHQDDEKNPHQTPRSHASVYVSTVSPIESQTVTVLSAAVSSVSRIQHDKHSAIEIAKKMDIQKNIPPEACLEAILKRLFPNSSNDESAQGDEDALDTAIAYLRRVHLFTFYNGCYAAENIGNCLTAGHPTSVIHQRLKNADAILKKMQEDNEAMSDNDLPTNTNSNQQKSGGTTKNEPKDMLVMRLDDSISKALSRLPDVLMMPSPFVVNETIDVIASEIESLEEKMKKEWLQNHSVIDSDNRARCSFHFCRKLFKDETFLRKHLLKKHKEFLSAELAKCHDPYMMKWWDEEVIRPVPMILIDCGSKFGYIPSLVCGAAEPCARDPEPEMWKKEQERILKEKEKRDALIEYRRALTDNSNENSQKFMQNRGSGIEDRAVVPTNTFVDVDDMKDEKVELSFNEVDVTQQNKKKKKKKKKLL